MDPLEAQRVQEPGRIADDQRPGHMVAWHGMPPALGERLGPVADHLAAGQDPRYQRVHLEALKRDMRVEQRVSVVEPRHEPDRDPTLGEGVDKAATKLFQTQGVAHGVDHRTRLEPVRTAPPTVP